MTSWAFVVAGAIVCLVSVRRYPPVRAGWGRVRGQVKRLHTRTERLLAWLLIGAALAAALYELSVPIVVGVVFGFLAGNVFMQRGVAGTVVSVFLAAIGVVVGLIVGHLVWAGVLAAFALELHRNRATAFARPEQQPHAPLDQQNSPLPPPPTPPAATKKGWFKQ